MRAGGDDAGYGEADDPGHFGNALMFGFVIIAGRAEPRRCVMVVVRGAVPVIVMERPCAGRAQGGFVHSSTMVR